MGAGRGRVDLGTWVVKVFALHKQCAVSVTVESSVDAIVRVCNGSKRCRFKRAIEDLETLLRVGVRPSSYTPMRPVWVRFVSYRGVGIRGRHERNATSQDLLILAYPGRSRLPRSTIDLALRNMRTHIKSGVKIKPRGRLYIDFRTLPHSQSLLSCSSRHREHTL